MLQSKETTLEIKWIAGNQIIREALPVALPRSLIKPWIAQAKLSEVKMRLAIVEAELALLVEMVETLPRLEMGTWVVCLLLTQNVHLMRIVKVIPGLQSLNFLILALLRWTVSIGIAMAMVNILMNCLVQVLLR